MTAVVVVILWSMGLMKPHWLIWAAVITDDILQLPQALAYVLGFAKIMGVL
jgi:hypothetical protein